MSVKAIQLSIFDILNDYRFVIRKPIRLIEFFAGYGSQKLALEYLGVEHESHRICEWCVPSIQAYKEIHYPNVNKDFTQAYSFETIVEYLTDLGISNDWNKPMEENAIKRKGEKWCRDVLNNIIITKNLVNIQRVKAKHLAVTENDKYTYLLTYSFPCQDISICGKMQGFTDTSTRSGMLWEVGRILEELHEQGKHIDVLLMENVTGVHNKKNIEDWKKWLSILENLGYSNFYEDLNAADFLIPQNRKRCFMVSIYDPEHKYHFSFPKPLELELRLKHLLEKNVDEKYFLSSKIVSYYEEHTEEQKEKGNGFRFEPQERENIKVSKTVNTRFGNRMDDTYIYDTGTNSSVEK